MIVKNEFATLEDSVQSVLDFVDEIVIGVDTQSDDGSRELAERLADKVVDIHLTDELAKGGPVSGEGDWGFSEARNRVLNACNPENWRLILDGHERVIDAERMIGLVGKVATAGGDGIEIPVLFERDKDGVPTIRYGQSRLLGPKVRYRNAIHNVPVISVPHTSSEVSVEHRKKAQKASDKQARDVQRSSANIDGFKAKVAANPKDSRSWFYLGNAYKEKGMWRDATGAYQAYLEISTWKEERWHARFGMGSCYKMMGELEKSGDQYSRSMDEFPVMVEALVALGDLAYIQQRFREAQIWLERAITMPMPTTRLFVAPRIYLVARHDLLSMVYDHLGMYKEAIDQAEIALKTTDNDRIKRNVEIWKEWLERNGQKTTSD
jgi:hypothetical protein